ncbi:hypothetical protein [Streptomyces litchfieldiae]|uniref:Uncharacterized protein n=1 Tax=Streptomyces litchfieldiae TaxID=3075543 RepID=A0ABU2MRW4_9ACTN|nr:hypothetical protein [Streptomyces sp. DSM 44938]MDT0344157.1 hypothetical protein [Streptomyces sp. DSM 44938]
MGARVGPDDQRYEELVRRGINQRYRARPDEVRVVGTTDQVVAAVRDAVRGGGHCFENFVDHPDVRMISDMSGMRSTSTPPGTRSRWRPAPPSSRSTAGCIWAGA